MIRTTSHDLEQFSQYAGLLLRLHELIASGDGDTDEADGIRDRMDYPWKNLSPQQLKLVNGLSADLYTIGADRLVPTSKPDEKAWGQFHEVAAREDWCAALVLLRESEADLPPDQVAYIRGACWAYLAQPDVAVTFLREKQRIKPLEVGEEVLLLTCLVQADRIDEATARAREIATQESEPALLLKAAEVLFVEASKSENPKMESLHRNAIDVVRRGLELGEAGPGDEMFESLRPSAYVHMSLSYDQLGETESALRSCEKALQVDPNNCHALAHYGQLAYGKYSHTERQAFRGTEHRRLAEDRGLIDTPPRILSLLFSDIQRDVFPSSSAI